MSNERVLAELVRRRRRKAAIRAEMFGKQLAVIDDDSRFRAIHPGRRSGKSETLVRAAALIAEDAEPGDTVIIGAETGLKAKALHWGNLLALSVRCGLGYVPNGSTSSFTTPVGVRLTFYGMADSNAVELLRGYRMCGALFDEVATFAPRLHRLVSDVVEPALGDTGGPCLLFGTPSVTTSGGWFDICTGVTPGWSVHHWTVLENEKFPRDARSVLEQVRIRNQWNEENATYRREWLGQFVNDAGMMVYQYNRARNAAEGLPVPLDRGFCTLGIDYGTTDDPCAWVVVWSAKGSRDMYIVEAAKHYGMLPDDAAEVTKRLIERWKPQRTVGDAGGLGAPYVAAFNRRYGHIGGEYVQKADKMHKLGQIAVVNGELSSGRIKVLPAAQVLADEWQVLPWKNEKKQEEDPSYADDCSDAARYAILAHFADVVPLPNAPTADEAARAAAAERQRRARDKTVSLLRR